MSYSIEEMKQRERYHYENYPCINQVIPYKSREELLQYKKDRSKTEKQKKEKHCIVKNIDKNYQSKSVRGIMRRKMKSMNDGRKNTYAYVELKTQLVINRNTKKPNDTKTS